MDLDRRQALALLGMTAVGAAGLCDVDEAGAQEPGLYQIGDPRQANLGKQHIGFAPLENGGFVSLGADDAGALNFTRLNAQLKITSSSPDLVPGEKFVNCAPPVRASNGVTLVAAIRRTGEGYPYQGQPVLYRISDTGAVIGGAIVIGAVELFTVGRRCRMIAIGDGALLVAWQPADGSFSNVRYRIVGETGALMSPVRSIKRKRGRDPFYLNGVLALAGGDALIAYSGSDRSLLQKIDRYGAPLGGSFSFEANALIALPDGGFTAVSSRTPPNFYDRATMRVQYQKGDGTVSAPLESLIDLNVTDGEGFQVLRASDGRLVVAVGGGDYTRAGKRYARVLLMLLTGKGRQLGKPTVLVNYQDYEEAANFQVRSLIRLADGSYVVGWTRQVGSRPVGATNLHRFQLV